MNTCILPAVESVSLTGQRPEEVLNVIRERARTESREDGHRLALVVEGGSMRGVHTAGSLVALHLMGFGTLFDNAYGTSAGAVNTAHFLSGSGHLKADTFYRFLADGRFYDANRLRKIVDIDYLMDEVLTKHRPIDVEMVMKSVTPLWVAVADFVTARTLLFCAQSANLPLLQLLKASTAMPLLYNKLIDLGTVRGFDAGFIQPFPLREALSHENSHILVLLTTTEGFVSPVLAAQERVLIDRRFARGHEAINKMFERSGRESDHVRDIAHGRLVLSPHSAIATIAPVSEEVDFTTQNPELLRAALLDTARGTLRLFGHSEKALDELVQAGCL